MKLAGIRVIDLSSFLPGPYLTMSLADHGAEVIKVEPPAGDPGRQVGLSDGPETVFFRNLNRGKKSVVIDLKATHGREALLKLCDSADVFVETSRPGVAKRLGVDYETISARNPRIVYCSISAFGQTGPYRDRPAHDLAIEAVSGALSLTVGPDGHPVIPAIAAADNLAALQALSGILMALLARERTGRGDYLDIAMHDATLAATSNILGPALAENRQSVPGHERSMGGSAFYQVYATSDGRHVVLAGQEDKFIETLLHALDRPDLIDVSLRGPGAHQEPVRAFLASVFARKTQSEAIAWLATMDLCFAPVKTMPEALADENARARGMLITDDLGRTHIGPAIRFRHEPPRPNLQAPKLGQHNAALLKGA